MNESTLSALTNLFYDFPLVNFFIKAYQAVKIMKYFGYPFSTHGVFPKIDCKIQKSNIYRRVL
jgi:hypothetical protein